MSKGCYDKNAQFEVELYDLAEVFLGVAILYLNAHVYLQSGPIERLRRFFCSHVFSYIKLPQRSFI